MCRVDSKSLTGNGEAFMRVAERGHLAHQFPISGKVRHSPQGPSRGKEGQRPSYTVVAHLPIEMDGRVRYRIRNSLDGGERIVTEEQLSTATTETNDISCA
jgi:hypothetical protein